MRIMNIGLAGVTLAWSAMLSPGVLDAQVQACSLLTKTQVQTAIGRAVLPPDEQTMPQHSVCRFGDPTAPTSAGKVIFHLVSLTAFSFADAAAAQQVYDMGKGNAASVEEVPGVGDEAFWDKILHTLWIRRGKYELALDVGNSVGGLTAAKKLAPHALAKLP